MSTEKYISIHIGNIKKACCKKAHRSELLLNISLKTYFVAAFASVDTPTLALATGVFT